MAAVGFLMGAGCDRKPVGPPVPSGPLMEDYIHFAYGVFFLPVPVEDPRTALQVGIDASRAELKVVSEMPAAPGELVVRPVLLTDLQQSHRPPDPEFLRQFGRGLTGEQTERLQHSQQFCLLEFGHPQERVWQGLRLANQLVEQVARKSGGLVWDDATREVFTPDAWHKKRLENWAGDVPVIAGQIVIHAYNTGQDIRAITLGMSKCGLPDAVVDGFSWEQHRAIQSLLVLVCQAMAEGQTIHRAGEFDLDLDTIKFARASDRRPGGPNPTAAGVARLTLKQAPWQQGDPENRVIEIAFDGRAGRDRHAKQASVLAALFGPVTLDAFQAEHSPEILAASEEARRRLPALREAFTAGLQPGEFIEVYARFAARGAQQELLWVRVGRWDWSRIGGMLLNEPVQVPDLHAGQAVTVNEAEVFDYIWRHPDGSTEGNRTGELLRASKGP